MRVGPEHYQWVSPDSAGVPTGGRWGNVGEFRRRMARHGLKVAWSRLWRCFYIYTQPSAARFVTQLACSRMDNSEPIPLTRALAGALLQCWSKVRRHSHQALERGMAAMARTKQEAARRKWLAEQEDVMKDAERSSKLIRRVITPKAFYIPTHLGRMN